MALAPETTTVQVNPIFEVLVDHYIIGSSYDNRLVD
jgi:hypothetical protein